MLNHSKLKPLFTNGQDSGLIQIDRLKDEVPCGIHRHKMRDEVRIDGYWFYRVTIREIKTAHVMSKYIHKLRKRNGLLVCVLGDCKAI